VKDTMAATRSIAEMTPTLLVNESPLRISVATAGPTREVSIVRVDGVVDTMTAGELDRVISSLVARGRYRLIVDLAGVEYISSAGWGIFVSYLREIREHGGDLRLARMTPDVREIYELLEFDGLLAAYDRLETAESEFYHSTGTSAPDTATTEVPTSGVHRAGSVPAALAAPQPLSGTTLDQAVLDFVAEDPFYTISEIRRLLHEHYAGRFAAGWWRVFSCLRRQRLLGRRARFRHFRRARKNAG